MIHESPYLQELLALHASRHNERGGALAAAGKFDEAIAEFRDGLRLKPDSAQLFWNLGRAIVARGGPAAEAIVDLRRAVELDPSQGPPHYDLASTLLDLHRYSEAIDEFRAAVALMPTSVEAHNNLGIALGSTGKLQEAIAEFQLAVQLNPENTEARHNLDSALQAVGSGGAKH
jgi:Flp pilus assembly protein TadD